MRALFEVMGQFSFWDLVDVAIVSLLVYSVLVWFKRTKAVFVAVGMFILAGVYLLARGMNLVLTAYIFQGFFAVFLIALVVIFQEELRHFFERVAVWSLGGPAPTPLQAVEIELLVRTLGDLSREKVGALVVLKGKDPVERHISGGEELDGRLSEALLKSIFDPHSEGHDGAIIIDRNRIQHFGALLPLSKEFQKIGKGGTRHAAGLGLAELTDALCLIVSEERGSISVAHNGELAEVPDLPALQDRIAWFLREIGTTREPLREYWHTNLREKAAAILLSFGFWLLFAEGSKTISREYDVPIVAHNVPAGLAVEGVEPEAVRATLAGLRRDFYLLDAGALRVHLDLSRGEPGPRGYMLSEKEFHLPDEISLMRLDPPTVTVELARTDGRGPLAPAPPRSGTR